MTATTHPKLTPPSGPILPGVLRSEYTKLLATRSTYWLLLTTVVATVGVGAIVSAAYTGQYTPEFAARHTIDPTYWSLNGLHFAQLAIGMLGLLTITGEHGTDLISTTFTAVPHRRTVLLAKTVATATVALAVGLVSSLIAFFAGQAILAGKHIEANIGQPAVLRSVLGGGLYLAVLAVFALGLGTLIRRTAGATATFLGLLLVLPAIGAVLPNSWQDTITPYFPGNAGPQIFHVLRMAHTVPPWTGFATFCGYTAVAYGAALLILPRRDTMPR